MIQTSDLIHCPYPAELTQAGIVYACRSLAYTYDRMGGSVGRRLRRIVGGIGSELAFRRQLTAAGIGFDTLGTTPFTDPDRYDVSLGTRRCDVKSFLIMDREKIGQLRADPVGLLDAAALVPVDQANSEQFGDNDLYIFTFALALTAATWADQQRALAAGQPMFWVHPLPEAWARPQNWLVLNPLALMTEDVQPLGVELGGQGDQRQFITERLRLLHQQRLLAQTPFYTLAYLHAARLPEGWVSLHSPRIRQVYLVKPKNWLNIWLYGVEIILAGYITRGEFRQRASRLPRGSRVWQYGVTRTDNLALPVADLHPLGRLFNQARNWAGQGS